MLYLRWCEFELADLKQYVVSHGRTISHNIKMCNEFSNEFVAYIAALITQQRGMLYHHTSSERSLFEPLQYCIYTKSYAASALLSSKYQAFTSHSLQYIKFHFEQILRSHQKMNATTIMCQLLWIELQARTSDRANAHALSRLLHFDVVDEMWCRTREETCTQNSGFYEKIKHAEYMNWHAATAAAHTDAHKRATTTKSLLKISSVK